jgi:transcriptional regulator with XRE-family HTH domain
MKIHLFAKRFFDILLDGKGAFMLDNGENSLISTTDPVLGTDTVYERIKQLRSALKLSQVKFAREIHISNGYLAEIELNHCPVNKRIIALIAAAFSVNESWLQTGEGSMFKLTSPLCQTSAQRFERMTQLFNGLYPEFQDYILNQIDQLLRLQDMPHSK